MLKIAYHTLGCKVNQYETEKTREALEGAGFETAPFSHTADVYIINTCSVTHVADSKSRAAIRRAIRLNPQAYVVVAGCYAELEPDRVTAIGGVDLVVPHEQKDALAERLIARFSAHTERPHPNPLPQEREQIVQPRERVFRDLRSRLRLHATEATAAGSAGASPSLPDSPLSTFHSPLPVRPRLRTRAVVKVQDGCDQFCAYCVVPYARSGKKSRPMESVLDELRVLGEFGYREIVLAGIRLGSYRDGDARLPELIASAAEIKGIGRIRLSSIEPWEVDDVLLDAMAHPKVCRHLHIPLQSGDDGVLARMNRPYSSEEYRWIVDHVRSSVPGIGVTTDVIVGFPGEDDAAFTNTRAMIEGIDFSRLHVFRYSARDRTKAASMPDQVPDGVKKLRAQKLIELGRLAVLGFAASQVGRVLEVLVESESGPYKSMRGFADNYVEVRLPGDSSMKGEIVRVEITGTDQGVCLGVGS